MNRKPFFELLIEGRIDVNSSEEKEEESVISLQTEAKRWFDAQVAGHVAKCRDVH